MTDGYALAMSKPAVASRHYAFELEERMRELVGSGERSEVEFPLKHFFADGCYVRALFLPKDTFVVGKIHKHEHLALMLCGDISIVDLTGVKRLTGYQLPFVSQPGAKRAVAVHEDTWFLTIHQQREYDKGDHDAIERAYVAETEAEFEAFIQSEFAVTMRQQQQIEVKQS